MVHIVNAMCDFFMKVMVKAKFEELKNSDFCDKRLKDRSLKDEEYRLVKSPNKWLKGALKN